jgi:hypothetical protein
MISGDDTFRGSLCRLHHAHRHRVPERHRIDDFALIEKEKSDDPKPEVSYVN